MAKRWQEADLPEILQCDECQKSLKPLGVRRRTLQTLCGPIRIERRVYYCEKCRAVRVPLDRRLGVEQTALTPGLMRVVCRTALELPYQQSARLLTETLGFSPCSAREIERVANRHGEQVERLIKAGASEQPAKTVRAKKAEYCLAIDGVMIPGQPDPEKHRLDWNEVKLGVIFHPQRKRLPIYLAGREDAESFGNRLQSQLQMRDLDERSFLLALGDGASWIWNLIDLHLPGVAQLLDFYHASEHLHATAQLIWSHDAAKRWWQRRLDQLKSGKIANFFAALERLARLHKGLDSDQSPVRLLRYFRENEKRLIYAWAIKNRLPIGSGMVESAARHIVQQRLKQSGMRWSDAGAQAILNLRTLHRSGEFEQYWEDQASRRLPA